jgi:hypothetical protein
MSLVLQSSGGGSVTIAEPTTASNFTQTLPAATGDVALLQTPAFATTIGVGGATPSTSGAGITFPATQSSSSDANTLDDYEEGSFTPTIVSGLTGITYTVQTGIYTKIGNVVTFNIRISMSSSTRNGSNFTFGGLPFTSKNVAGINVGSVSWAYTNFVTNSTTVNVPTLYIGGNLTTCDCYKTDGNPFVGTDLAGITPDLYIGGSYFTE